MSLKNTCKLIHLSKMKFSTLINWTSPFPFYGFLDGIFFLFKFCDPDQTSDLGLHCLPRLKWVKTVFSEANHEMI